MKAHRLPAHEEGVSALDVATYGDDNRAFPTGVNHVVNHRVPQAHPLVETRVGPFIKDVGSAPSVWHGEPPTVSRETVEDEWTRRQKEATMDPGIIEPPHDNPDPVPVWIVNPNTGSEGIASWTGGNFSCTDQGVEIAGRDYKRTRLFICNEDASLAIRISRTTGNQSGFGFLIKAGATQELATQDKVYAIPAIPGGTPIKVSVLFEYGIDGGN